MPASLWASSSGSWNPRPVTERVPTVEQVSFSYRGSAPHWPGRTLAKLESGPYKENHCDWFCVSYSFGKDFWRREKGIFDMTSTVCSGLY